MHRVFQIFVERLNDGRDPDTFQKAMAEAAQAFDLPCFAYLRMPRDGQASAALISTYPTKWTDHYLNKHYERLDPVIRQVNAFTEPFEWGLGADDFFLTCHQKSFFDEASEFGIRCGFTVPIRDGRGPAAGVTFASDVRRPAFLRSIALNRRVLQLMAICLHAHARRKLWLNPVVGGISLSPRELECLRWAAAGKTAWGIGQILGVTERTANFHLANVRAKLGVETVREAVVLYVTGRTALK